MKKTRIKVLAVVMALVMVAVSSSLLTVAYLTSKTDAVTNTFSNSGKVKITLDETKVDKYGGVVPSASPVQSNDYLLIPGHTYRKDPTIHVESGSELCYLFVKVTNGLKDIEASDVTDGGSAEYNTILSQMTNMYGWKCIDETDGIYMYCGKDYEYENIDVADEYDENGCVVDARDGQEDRVVFTLLNIKTDAELYDDATPSPSAKYSESTIEIIAYAIQADGFDRGIDAWNASGFAPTPAPASSTHPVASGS